MKPKLKSVLRDLELQIKANNNLIDNIKRLKINYFQLEIITEFAFLRIFMAWEIFLEDSFLRYLVGTKSPSGYEPKLKIDCKNMVIARGILSPDGGKIIKWNSPSDIISRASKYFKDGEPYTTNLETISTYFQEMNTIRNRITHKSDESKQKFINFIRGKFGYGIRGITPGRFLLRKFNQNKNYSFLDFYIDVIKSSSLKIVP